MLEFLFCLIGEMPEIINCLLLRDILAVCICSSYERPPPILSHVDAWNMCRVILQIYLTIYSPFLRWLSQGTQASSQSGRKDIKEMVTARRRVLRSHLSPKPLSITARNRSHSVTRYALIISRRFPARQSRRNCYLFCRCIYFSFLLLSTFADVEHIYLLQPHGTDFERTMPEKELLSQTSPAILDSTPVTIWNLAVHRWCVMNH